MTQDSLNCEARIHKQKISKNQLLNKEEAELDKSEHQTSFLSLISTDIVNGGRPKGMLLKNKEKSQRDNI